MSATVRELRDWLRGRPAGQRIGIDEGGLALIVAGHKEDYYEIGGAPELTADQVRTLLVHRVEGCDSDECPGWAIFNEAEGRPEIEVCDECTRSLILRDDDVALLPEAQKALRAAWRRVRRLERRPDPDPDHEVIVRTDGTVARG